MQIFAVEGIIYDTIAKSQNKVAGVVGYIKGVEINVATIGWNVDIEVNCWIDADQIGDQWCDISKCNVAPRLDADIDLTVGNSGCDSP